MKKQGSMKKQHPNYTLRQIQNETEPFKITRPGEVYGGPHIGPRLARKLDTHRWHVLRNAYVNDPQPETYEAVVSAKSVTPNAIKKLIARAWCARQIMWPNRQNGILLEVGADGCYLVTPGNAMPALAVAN